MSCEMLIPYAGYAGILLIMQGKLTIGKVKSSCLSLLIFLGCGFQFQVEGQGKETDTALEDTVRERIIQQEVNLDASENL